MSPAFYLMLPLLPAATIIFQLCTRRVSATIVSTGESDGVLLQCFAPNNSSIGALCPKYFRFFQPPKGCCGRLTRKHPDPHSHHLGQIRVSKFEASFIDGEMEDGERESIRVEGIDLNKRLTQILRKITNSIRKFSRIRGSIKKKTKAPEISETPATTPITTTTTPATTTDEATKPTTTGFSTTEQERSVVKPRPSPHSEEVEGETTAAEKPREHKVTGARPPPPVDVDGSSSHKGRGGSTVHRTTTPSAPEEETKILGVGSGGRAILPGATKIIYCIVARFRKGQPICPKDHPYDLKRAMCCGPTPIKMTPLDVNDIVEPARPTTPKPKPTKIPDFKQTPITTSTSRSKTIPKFISRDCVDFVQPGKFYSDCPSNKEKCNDPKWYKLMSKICPKTCKRCKSLKMPWPELKGQKGKGLKPTGWLRGYPSLTMLLKKNTSICLDGLTADGKSTECGTFSYRCNAPVWDRFMSTECPVTCGTCEHLPSLPALLSHTSTIQPQQ